MARSMQQPLLSPVVLAEGDLEGWLRTCWTEGVTAGSGEMLIQFGRGLLADKAGKDRSDPAVGVRAFAAMAAMGRGDYDLADALLEGPIGSLSPEVSLLDSAARLYRACGDAERDPGRALTAMQELCEARRVLGALATPEAGTARGYAGLCMAEALLVVGDVGAARHQLEVVLEEAKSPHVTLTTVRFILGAIEQAVGRPDLAIMHLQAAVREAAAHPAEEQLAQLLLAEVLLSSDRRYGVALFEDFVAQTESAAGAPAGRGTVTRLYQLLKILSRDAPFSAGARMKIRDLLRGLQGRHYSAGWFLLFTGICAGALRAAGDPCESYSVLIHAAAMLRCRHMDGAASLCDRQIEALRSSLGEDQFEALLREARKRRQAFAALADEQPKQHSN